MAQKVAIPDGTYAARVYETAVPKAFYSQWLRRHAGAGAKRVLDLYGVMWGFIVGGVLATLPGVLLMPRKASLAFAIGTAALIGATVALARSGAYRRAVAAREEFAREFPRYVVRLG